MPGYSVRYVIHQFPMRKQEKEEEEEEEEKEEMKGPSVI